MTSHFLFMYVYFIQFHLKKFFLPYLLKRFNSPFFNKIFANKNALI